MHDLKNPNGIKDCGTQILIGLVHINQHVIIKLQLIHVKYITYILISLVHINQHDIIKFQFTHITYIVQKIKVSWYNYKQAIWIPCIPF